MRISIIVDDDMVVVDGASARVDCSALKTRGLHALQWHDDYGEEEYAASGNAIVEDFGPYQPYLDAWEVQYAADQAEMQAIEDAHNDAIAAGEAGSARAQAWNKLPTDLQQGIIEREQQRLEQEKRAAWDAMSYDEQQQTLRDAGY